MDTILESLLLEEAGISLAKLDIRDIGIQLFCLAERQIGKAVVVAVCTELPALEIVRGFANGLHVLFGALQHGRQVVMVLALERLSVHDNLVFAIH
jgi:hypothetical protein